MATLYADIQDVITLFRDLSPEEKTRAEALLPQVCSYLQIYSKKVGKNLDEMVLADTDMMNVAKQVTVDVVARELMTPTTGQMGALSQYSQSALGYTVSGTFLSPGGGLFVKNAELSALGLKRPKYGMMEFQIGGDCSC